MLVAVLLAAIALAPATARPGDIIKSSQPEAKSKAVPPADLLIEQLKKMVPQISLDRYRSLLASIKTTGPIVDARKYRWQVAIRIPVANKRCGGILISKIFVLTAAHCLDRNRLSGGPPMAFDRGQVEIFHGSDVFAAGTRLALDPAWPIILYPGWRDPNVSGTDAEGAFDAALIKLAQPVTAAVPAPVRSLVFAEGDAVVSGWGAFDATGDPSQYLRAVRVPVVQTELCKAVLPKKSARLGAWALCAMSKSDDACARDSGGPLVIGTADHPQTVGIVSWGEQTECGVPGTIGQLVGVYTRVSAIAGWIAEITGDVGATTTAQPGVTFAVTPATAGGAVLP